MHFQHHRRTKRIVYFLPLYMPVKEIQIWLLMQLDSCCFEVMRKRGEDIFLYTLVMKLNYKDASSSKVRTGQIS